MRSRWMWLGVIVLCVLSGLTAVSNDEPYRIERVDGQRVHIKGGETGLLPTWAPKVAKLPEEPPKKDKEFVLVESVETEEVEVERGGRKVKEKLVKRVTFELHVSRQSGGTTLKPEYSWSKVWKLTLSPEVVRPVTAKDGDYFLVEGAKRSYHLYRVKSPPPGDSVGCEEFVHLGEWKPAK